MAEVRRRHHDTTQCRWLLRLIERGRRGDFARAAPHAQQDGLDVVARAATAGLDDTLDLVDSVFLQQSQDAHVVLDAATGAVLFLQGLPQFAEDRRQLPAAKNVGVIQPCRPALQSAQVVLRIEDLLVLAVATRMTRDYLAASHDVDAVDVRFDGHGLESRRTRHAVAVVVETHHLVLVGLGRLDDTGIEAVLG